MAAPSESPAMSVQAFPADTDPRTLVVVVGGRIDDVDIPMLCDSVCDLLRIHDVDRVVCDVGEVHAPDVVSVDALARLQLAAKRLGRSVSVRHAPSALRELLIFSGLAEIVPSGD